LLFNLLSYELNSNLAIILLIPSSVTMTFPRLFLSNFQLIRSLTYYQYLHLVFLSKESSHKQITQSVSGKLCNFCYQILLKERSPLEREKFLSFFKKTTQMRISLKVIISILFFLQYNFAISLVDSIRVKQHIETLSSDDMEGRLVGSKGERMAAEYIIKYFKELNLIPLQNKEFEHAFSFNYNQNPHGASKNSDTISGINVVAYIDNGEKHTFVIGAHYDHLGYNEYNMSTDAKRKRNDSQWSRR